MPPKPNDKLLVTAARRIAQELSGIFHGGNDDMASYLHDLYQRVFDRPPADPLMTDLDQCVVGLVTKIRENERKAPAMYLFTLFLLASNDSIDLFKPGGAPNSEALCPICLTSFTQPKSYIDHVDKCATGLATFFPRLLKFASKIPTVLSGSQWSSPRSMMNVIQNNESSVLNSFQQTSRSASSSDYFGHLG